MIGFFKDIFRLSRQKVLRLWLLSQTRKMKVSAHSSLIIAPHPDDETFGCAGLIVQKSAAGSSVTVVLLTRGEKSLPGVSSDEVGSHRLNTAQKVAASLGAKSTICLGFPDGAIPRRGSAEYVEGMRKLEDTIRQLEPSEVYCTHDAEGWSDHTAAFELTYDALRQIDRPIALYKYWVWIWFSLPLRNIGALNFRQTLRLPISNEWPLKKSAINSYLTDQAEDGRPYCGILPKRFVSAFSWPYEVYEKVEY